MEKKRKRKGKQCIHAYIQGMLLLHHTALFLLSMNLLFEHLLIIMNNGFEAFCSLALTLFLPMFQVLDRDCVWYVPVTSQTGMVLVLLMYQHLARSKREPAVYQNLHISLGLHNLRPTVCQNLCKPVLNLHNLVFEIPGL